MARRHSPRDAVRRLLPGSPSRRPPPAIRRRDRRRADGDARGAEGASIIGAVSVGGWRPMSVPVIRQGRRAATRQDADAQPARPWRGCARGYFRMSEVRDFRLPHRASRSLCRSVSGARRPRSVAATASGRMGMRAAPEGAASTPKTDWTPQANSYRLVAGTGPGESS